MIKQTSPLKSPIDEQQKIIDAIANGSSVFSDSVAGSGKSHTILWLAKTLGNKSIIQITYNASLKFEVREKVAEYSLKNISIHTYHSLGLKYYDENIRDDITLENVLTKNLKIKESPSLDILVVDESQDMTPSYYQFIQKFILDVGRPLLLLLLGG